MVAKICGLQAYIILLQYLTFSMLIESYQKKKKRFLALLACYFQHECQTVMTHIGSKLKTSLGQLVV
jgi:hypothetical protein